MKKYDVIIIGGGIIGSITHYYLSKLNHIKKQLDLITQYSTDIGMKFGESKCAFLVVKRGKLVPCPQTLNMNGLTIQPLHSGENYKYLGQDENVRYDGPIN